MWVVLGSHQAYAHWNIEELSKFSRSNSHPVSHTISTSPWGVYIYAECELVLQQHPV